MQAEPFHIVVGVIESANLHLAAVARAGIHLAYVQRTAEQPARTRAHGVRDNFDLGAFIRWGEGLGNHRASSKFFQKVSSSTNDPSLLYC